MKKFILTLITIVTITTNVFAAKIVKDDFENNVATYHQQADEREDLIKFFVDSGDNVAVMHDIVGVAHKAGKLTDEQVKEFLKLVKEERAAGDVFWEYVKVMDAVDDGKLPPNKFSNRSFVWKYNDWAHKYNKLVKFVKVANKIIEK